MPRRASLSAARRGALVLAVCWLLTCCSAPVTPPTPTTTPSRVPASASTPAAVDVTALGAVGDGVADDRPAVQAALDRAGPGGRVYFPAGSYRLASATQPGDRILVTQPGQQLRGAGAAESTLLVGRSFPAYVTVIGAARDAVGIGSWLLGDLTIDQNAAAGNALDTRREDRYPRMALRLGDHEDGDVTVERSGFRGSDSLNTVYLYGSDLRVTGNRFDGIGGRVGGPAHDHSTVYLTTTVPHGVQRVTDNVFRGNSSSVGARTAIETHGGSQVLSGNDIADYVRGFNVTGIADVASGPVSVTGNRVAGTAIGVQLWSWAASRASGTRLAGLRVRGNTFDLDGTAWRFPDLAVPTAGVLVTGDNTVPVAGLAVTGNTIRITPDRSASAKPSTGVSCRVSRAAARPTGVSVAGNTITGADTAVGEDCASGGGVVRSNVVRP
ncbi:glycosyl hydrolase family 28-related protein [uncultured Friedmanniella sp.]|uniref:glycosyl hydrolase family 28-related protein n=1 Tax=uncultured Friedmanniella sp. TaxID=335381 RepID=UPI0035CC72C0